MFGCETSKISQHFDGRSIEFLTRIASRHPQIRQPILQRATHALHTFLRSSPLVRARLTLGRGHRAGRLGVSGCETLAGGCLVGGSAGYSPTGPPIIMPK